MTIEEPYVGVNEVSAFLNNLTPQTVKLWAKAGKIPGTKPGKYWLFQLSEVKKALQQEPVDPWTQSPQSRGRKRVT